MSGLRGGELFIGADLLVEYGSVDVPGSGLFDNNLRAFDNTATITFDLKDSANTSVSGAAGSCSYLTGSQGCYRGVLEDAATATLTRGSTYDLVLTVAGSNDRVDVRRISYIAKYRGAT